MFLKTSRKSGPRVIESRSLVDEYLAKELSRRQIMAGLMATSAASLLGCTEKTVVENGSSGGPGGENQDGGGVDPAVGKHLTGLGYHESDRAAALEAALAETIGLSMIKPGQSVYLRVNANSGDLYPYSTSPDTIRQIGGLLADLGVTDIRVGDRSFWGDKDTAGNLTANGITKAAKDIGTSAIAYEDNVDWVTLPAGSTPNWVGSIRLPEPVMTADHIIILSVVKTHFISQITMSLKIALGLVHADDRERDGNLRTHDTKVLYKQTAQINKAFTPSLVINDGYKAVVSGGPTKRDKPQGAPANWSGGVTADPKIFIVSPDRIAADVAGIAVLQTVSPSYEAVTRTAPFSNPAIAAAVAAGLGISGPDEMDISGPTVPNIDELISKIAG